MKNKLILFLCAAALCATAVIASISTVKAKSLTLKYDDRYTFPDAIASIEAITKGNNDAEVIRIKSDLDRDVGVACGIGTARVTLHNGDVYEVTVEAAPISVFLLIGQSNAEGSTTTDASVYVKARNQSILCEEGQIYSTYAWSQNYQSERVAGLPRLAPLTVDTADYFVAETLTSEISRDGRPLKYPLNSLCAGEKGKVGFDSGFAWKWNQLTGEKVWVVNCGAGNTAISVWQPGAERYDNCVALMEQVKATMEEEIAAGHYELKNFAYFWLQGESDSGNHGSTATTQADYRAMLETMHTNLKADLTIDGKTLEGCGIIMVRAFTKKPATDTADNDIRMAQKEAIAATDGAFADVYLACIENDKWITDPAVKQYWDEKYPDSQYPFQVHAQAYKNPVDIVTVHNGTHYMQPGYNEIGIVSAENAFAYLRGE